MKTTRILTTSATGLVALFALAACGANSTPEPTKTETVTVTASPGVPASSSASSTSAPSATVTATQSASATANNTAAYTNDDVRQALDAVQKQYPNAVITNIDIDEHTNTFDVDVLDGDSQHELEVKQQDYSVTVIETDNRPDADDKAEAQEAKITALQAVNGALENKDGVLVDSAELERENGDLVWKVELDNEQGQDQATILVNAANGSMVQR